MTHSTLPAAPALLTRNFVRRISWSAVIAGVVLAAAVQLLLNLLGMAIGLWVVDADALGSFGIGAGVWWLLSSLISVFAGAWVASHLSGVANKGDGLLHGLLVWSLGSLLMIWLLTTAAGALIGGATSMVSRAAGAAGNVIESAMPEAKEAVGDLVNSNAIPGAGVMREMQDALTGPQAGEARQQLQQLFMQAREQDVQSPQFRQQLTSVLVQQGGMEQQRAQELTGRAITELQQAKQQLAAAGQQVKETGEEVAQNTGHAAFWAFLALLAGAIAAAFGGRKGTPGATLTADDGFVGSPTHQPAHSH